MIKHFTSFLLLAGCGGWLSAADTPSPTPYPLATCVVSGEKLGSMGDAVVIIREGREIKLCCKGCVKKFDKNPRSYLDIITQAEKTTPPQSPGADGTAPRH